MTLLSVHNVSKAFFGNLAVDNVSLQVEENSITGLIGANGAGKTTLFNCIAGSGAADSGKIYLNDLEVQKMPAHKLCKLGVARTFQITKPFGELSVLENVVVGGFNQAKKRENAYAQAQESLEFVGLQHKSNDLAYLLNTGEQRKLELARALATKPKLLLLDEVMAGLTPSESVEMVELIKKIRQNGITILMIEHIMPAVMGLSDVIYVLERGRVIANGTPAEVAADEHVISSYLGKGLEV